MNISFPSTSTTLGDLQVGGVFSLGDANYRKVSVAGQTPTSGYSFVMRLDGSNTVSELPNATVLPVAHSCQGDVTVKVECYHDTADAWPPSTCALSEILAGGLFVVDGTLRMRVVGPAEPPAGELWWVAVGAWTVSSSADSTTVRPVPGVIASLSPC